VRVLVAPFFMEWDGSRYRRCVHLTWRAICVYNGERFKFIRHDEENRWNVKLVQCGRAD
jgi:hypothetical protein